MWTVNFQMFQVVLEKAEKPEIKLPTSTRSWKKQESSRKTSISSLLMMPEPFTINGWKFWKTWEFQTTWPASWETYMQVRKQQLELDMEQQTGSKYPSTKVFSNESTLHIRWPKFYPFFFSSSSGTSIIQMLVHLIPSQRTLRLSSALFVLFTLF